MAIIGLWTSGDTGSIRTPPGPVPRRDFFALQTLDIAGSARHVPTSLAADVGVVASVFEWGNGDLNL